MRIPRASEWQWLIRLLLVVSSMLITVACSDPPNDPEYPKAAALFQNPSNSECPKDLTAHCKLFHHFGTVTSTGFCKGPDCFSGNQSNVKYDGLAQEVTAENGAGLYPKTWTLSLHRDAKIVGNNCKLPDGLTDGDIVHANSSLPINIGDGIDLFGETRLVCMLNLKVPPDDLINPGVAAHYYHEHFSSNAHDASSGCLGWMECEQEVIPDQPVPFGPKDLQIPHIRKPNPVEQPATEQ